MSKTEFELMHKIHDAFRCYEANRNITILEDSLVKLGNLKSFPKATELLYGMLLYHHCGDIYKMTKRLPKSFGESFSRNLLTSGL